MAKHSKDVKIHQSPNSQRQDSSPSISDSSDGVGHFSDLDDNSDAGILSNSSSSNPSHYASSETLSTTEDSWSVIVGDEGVSDAEHDQEVGTQTFVNGEISAVSSNGDFRGVKPSSDDLLETPRGSIQTLKGEGVSSSSAYTERAFIASIDRNKIDVTEYTCATELKFDLWESVRENSEYCVSEFLRKLIYVRKYLQAHRAVSFSMAIFAISCVIGRAVYLFDDYLWKNSILNKSLPVNYIADHPNYKVLYEKVCDNTQENLHNELTHCIADFFSTHPQANNYRECFDRYEQGLKQDAEFCGFDVDKLLRKEMWKYYGSSFQQSRELFQIATSKLFKGFVSWSVSSTQALGKKPVPSYTKVRNLIQKDGSEEARHLYNRYHEFQIQLINNWSKLYNASKASTVKIYNGRIVPMINAGLSGCESIYRNRLIPLNETFRKFYDQKIVPTARESYSRIKSFPFRKHANELHQEVLRLNKTIGSFLNRKVKDIEKAVSNILATV